MQTGWPRRQIDLYFNFAKAQASSGRGSVSEDVEARGFSSLSAPFYYLEQIPGDSSDVHLKSDDSMCI